MDYCVDHEKNLKEFLKDGDLPLDNNATEAALRTFCVHKHTRRLLDTIDGAKASAIVYSLTETAKANNLNPFRYLEFLLTELMEHQDDTDREFLKDLLPWSDQMPERGIPECVLKFFPAIHMPHFAVYLPWIRLPQRKSAAPCSFGDKSPTKRDAHLTESNFQTCSSTGRSQAPL